MGVEMNDVELFKKVCEEMGIPLEREKVKLL